MNADDQIAQEARADVQHFAAAIEYFETHDLSEELENMPEMHFEINIEHPSKVYYGLEEELSQKLRTVARERGVSAVDLLNHWVQEKAAEFLTPGTAE